MLTLLAILHVIIGLALVVFVLLQDPKDGASGIFGGGSSSKSFFGSTGASNFLSTATKWLAVAFSVTCLLLTGITTKHSSSVLDDATAAPVAPMSAPAGQQAAPANPAAPAQPAAPAANPAAPAPDAPKHE